MSSNASVNSKAAEIDNALGAHMLEVSASISERIGAPELNEQYDLLQPIGHGAQAKVYKARKHDGEWVAIKVFDLRDADDWKSVEMFKREVKALKTLNIDGIPRFIDYIESTPYTYLIESYIDTKSLQTMIDDRWRPSEAQVIEIIQKASNILCQLHAQIQPIINRDIKPANIMLNTETTPMQLWIIDLGAISALSHKTHASTIAGTVGYASPEQWMGRATPASDIYALGMTVIHLLSGKPPWEMDSDGLEVQYEKYLPKNLSVFLKDLIAKMVKTNPKERTQTAREVLALLNNSKQNRPSPSNIQSNEKGNALTSPHENREILPVKEFSWIVKKDDKINLYAQAVSRHINLPADKISSFMIRLQTNYSSYHDRRLSYDIIAKALTCNPDIIQEYDFFNKYGNSEIKDLFNDMTPDKEALTFWANQFDVFPIERRMHMLESLFKYDTDLARITAAIKLAIQENPDLCTGDYVFYKEDNLYTKAYANLWRREQIDVLLNEYDEISTKTNIRKIYTKTNIRKIENNNINKASNNNKIIFNFISGIVLIIIGTLSLNLTNLILCSILLLLCGSIALLISLVMLIYKFI